MKSIWRICPILLLFILLFYLYIPKFNILATSFELFLKHNYLIFEIVAFVYNLHKFIDLFGDEFLLCCKKEIKSDDLKVLKFKPEEERLLYKLLI